MGEAIAETCLQLLQEDFMQHFPVDVFQTGSGTSSNMNANEVVATLASRRLGGKVNPNDHVNCGQSSNDIIPSTIHISAALEISERLLPALRHLEQTIQSKAGEVHAYVKTGRTHLMDAMPVRMSQVLGGSRCDRPACTSRAYFLPCSSWHRAAPRWAPGSTPILGSPNVSARS